MQMLHPFVGSIQQYSEAISDPDRYRPDHCPQCEAKQPLTAHGSGPPFSLQTVGWPRSGPRRHPPEVPHTAFVWSRRTPRP